MGGLKRNLYKQIKWKIIFAQLHMLDRSTY